MLLSVGREFLTIQLTTIPEMHHNNDVFRFQFLLVVATSFRYLLPIE